MRQDFSHVLAATDYSNLIYSQRWTPLTGFDPEPTSEYTFTLPQSDALQVGTPLRYTVTGQDVFFYAAVSEINTDTVSIYGVSLDGVEIESLWYGNQELIVQFDQIITGKWANSVQNLLQPLMQTEITWNFPEAYLVFFRGYCNQLDSGSSQPAFNVLLGGGAVSLYHGGQGPEFSGNDVDSDVDYIDSNNYRLFFGDDIDIKCTATGTNKDANALTVSMMFVLA